MLTEQLAIDVGPEKLQIAREQRGDPKNPTVLLIMVVAAQLIHWPGGFLDALVGRGLHLVRFDNRDAGHSTHMTHAPAPDLPAALRGELSTASYTLSNMAADAVGLLDACAWVVYPDGHSSGTVGIPEPSLAPPEPLDTASFRTLRPQLSWIERQASKKRAGWW